MYSLGLERPKGERNSTVRFKTLKKSCSDSHAQTEKRLKCERFQKKDKVVFIAFWRQVDVNTVHLGPFNNFLKVIN